VTGTLNLLGLSESMSTLVTNDALMFGIMLLGAGLCFKIAAAPFHVWTPDVYEGAPTPITAFLSTASKAAAFAIFARIFYVGMHHFRLDWQSVLATVAALSMILGNLAAITQDNVKRMLAYSSIGHAGYVLLGIIAVSEMGLRGILVYSVVYVFATLGIWATVLMLARHEYAGERVDDFEGLHKRAPFWAFAMVVFLLSLGGIPPTAGFIGKYFLFYAAVGAGFGWLAVIAVLMSAVSMFFYFRIVMAMYLRDGNEAEVAGGGALKLVAAVCLAVTLIFGILPTPLIDEAGRSGSWVAKRIADARP
jgi:NADH-quinone oxidoreductase subunit N